MFKKGESVKDTLCSYYTNSENIISYMVTKLGISKYDLILEPAAGEGIFIDEILKSDIAVHIDALDIDEKAISVLHQKYNDNPAIAVRKTDTLLDRQLDSYDVMQLWLKETDTLFDEQLDYFGAIGGYYNKVIGNPPYGAWQDYKKRDLLKKKYAGHYVKETYSLFLLRCLSVLQMHGRLSFIIPDTYLFLNMHERLRKILLTKTKIEEILIFPSKFFPGVSFGYSNLSIITLERCESNEAKENNIRIIQGFHSSDEFVYTLGNEKNMPEHLQIYNFTQDSILNNAQSRFVLAQNTHTDILNSARKTLGDVADVVTGFYTGNNKKFIRVLDDTVKGSKGYGKVNEQQIYSCTSNDGIPNISEGYVPYVKSSPKRRYLREKDEWFVRWDSDTIKFYHADKKARFQNSSFYFQTGIGIPMVKSKCIRAFLMEKRVFDQSVVGIFPKDSKDLYYILALMNSEVINELIHIINPTVNNSANYVKQIPYHEPSDEMRNKINELVEKVLIFIEEGNDEAADSIHLELNCLISNIYNQEQSN